MSNGKAGAACPKPRKILDFQIQQFAAKFSQGWTVGRHDGMMHFSQGPQGIQELDDL
jgi:hypothetical protein